MDLFSNNSPPLYLHILHNDEEYEGNFEDLIDVDMFSSAFICTYVSSSPTFLFSKFSKFTSVDVIIGQEDAAVSFQSALPNPNNIFSTEFDEALVSQPKDILEKIRDGSIKVRYRRVNESIHSKIYILKGPFTRAMVGSANFTETALQENKFKQYEELIVYDSTYNGKFTEAFERRFQHLWDRSVNAITPELQKAIKNKLLIADNISAGTVHDSMIFANNVTAEKVSNSTIVLFDDKVKGKIVEQKLEEQQNVIEDFSEVVANVEQEAVNVYKVVEHVERAKLAWSSITKKEKDAVKLKPPHKVENEMREIVSKKFYTRKATPMPEEIELVDARNVLLFDEASKTFVLQEGEHGVPYPTPISDGTLKSSLEQLNSFIKSYALFSSTRNEEDAKSIETKVFETILYAFASPYIWFIRKDVSESFSSSEKVAEVPPFLIIGGNAGTGKTKLLLFINKLLGNKQDIYDYKQIDNRGKTLLGSLFRSNNTFPIVVDEISQNMFRGGGEELIKSVANTITGPHPCLVGATNQEFTSGAQVIRRIYYIDFPYPILSEKKQEAEDYFNNEVRMNDVDDRLFRAFLYEFQRNIEEGKPFYKIDDPLYLGRQIFRDFYARIGEKPPYFISNEPIGDYYKKGAKKWRAFYKMHKDDPNIIRHQDGLLFIDLVKAYGGNKGSDLEQRLPPYVIESKDNPLILYEDRFLEFISSENRRENPFERMKRIWMKKG